jgi:hypothetical protein
MRGGAAVRLANLRPLVRHCERSEAIQSSGAAAGLRRRCAPRNDGFAWLFAAFLFAAPAAAAPRTIDDCEAIKEANAYNLCLASFGPMRGQRGATYPGVASEGEKGSGGGKSGAARRTAAAHGDGRGVAHARGGRVRMEFTPGRR